MKTPTKQTSHRLAAVLSLAIAFVTCLKAVAFSVCAVGDSITRGASNFTAHRIALEKEFDRLGWIVEWKGTVKNASYGTTNPCEGYSSQNAESIAGQYESHATAVAADILLLHAGHNYDVASTPEADIVAAATNAHKRIIAAARTQNPNVVVLYAKVITSSLEKYSYIPTLNTAIGALGAELNTEASPVVVVDMADGWDPSTDCVSDGVHPTATGAAKMAKKWMAAINAQHEAGKIVNAPNITTDTTLSVDAQWDSVTVAANATLNLNGHKLTTGGVSGDGTIMSAAIDDSETPGKYGYAMLDSVTTPSDNLSTSQGYVDIGYKPAATDRIETKFRPGLVASGTSYIQWVFSARSSSSSKGLDGYIKGTSLNFQFGNKEDSYGTATQDGIYEVVMDGNKGVAYVVYENVLTNVALTGTAAAPDNNLHLFCTADGTTIRRWAQSMTMYYFRVFDKDGNLNVNMLPASKDGTAGFFDTVRKTFYPLVTSTENEVAFTAGSDISYERLAYVKTPDANTSYVDTLYMPQGTDRVETKVSVASTSGNEMIFSSRTSGSGDGKSFSCLKNGSKFRFDRGKRTGVAYSAAIAADTPYAIIADYGANSYILDEEVLSYVETDAFTPVKNISLFAASNDHSSPAKGCCMYYFRVTDTNGYERLNLIPARMTNGTVGFYDAVHNAFLAPTDGTLEAGDAMLRDLTAPGGKCWASLVGGNSTSVGNLFNDNFIYRTSGADSRFYFEIKGEKQLPLRVDYDFGEGKSETVNMYRIWGGGTGRSPGEWEFYGSDSAYGSSDEDGWTLLDTGASGSNLPGVAGDKKADCCTCVCDNKTAYRYYRLKITSKVGDSNTYFDFTQLEYFHVEATSDPGELHIAVADRKESVNSTVLLAGDLKLVKEGAGDFVSDVSGQFYTGGTKVDAGGFTLGKPLSTSLTMESGATLGFLFHDRDAAPLLTFGTGSSLPSPLNVAIYVGGDFALPGEGTKLTSGYDFSGATIDFTKTASARRLTTDATGNLWVYGPTGLMVIFR